ncbi:Gti1/Pac2 family-domain-containing protein, partial [Paraphysoderma sedebokerense]
ETFFGCINTLRDALIVIEGARQGLFPRVKHRPTLLDSVNIKSGSIFVWEQSEVKIVRWTDGKKWSNSKDIGAFVSYFERKEGEGDDEGSLDNRLHKKVTSVVTSDNLKFHLVAYYVPKDITSHLLKPPSSTLVEVPQKYYSRVKQHSSTNHWTQELSSRSPESTNELTVQKSSND